MANQPTPEQVNQVNTILQQTEPILQTQVVFIRDDPQNRQYINLAVFRPQYLSLGHDLFKVQPRLDNLRQNYVTFKNNWIMRSQLINYDGRDRKMVQSGFAGWKSSGQHRAVFPYIPNEMSGSQAQLTSNVGQQQQNLFVIDVETAQALRNQCVSWGDHQSLTYRLVRAAYGLLSLATTLNIFIDQDIHQQAIEDLRTQIHRLGSIYGQQLQSATAAEYIFKVAIIRHENMPALVPQVWPVAHPVMKPVPNYRPVPPFDPNNINIGQINDQWTAFRNAIVNHDYYTADWDQVFGQYANVGSSVAFLNTAVGHPTMHNITQLNGQTFQVEVTHLLGEGHEFFILNSTNFSDSEISRYRLRPVANWPAWVGDYYRNNLWLPLHSHGLAGSHEEGENNIRGNNGCQVMSLQFGHPLNDQRIYFINRYIARRLRQLFETHQIMVLYQRWFYHLLPLSRRICDARRLSRQVHNDADPGLLQTVQNCANQLHQFSNRLIANYHWLVRLEQIWKYSVLAPYINAPVFANREVGPRIIPTYPAMYGLGDGVNVHSLWPKDQGKGKGNEEQQQQ